MKKILSGKLPVRKTVLVSATCWAFHLRKLTFLMKSKQLAVSIIICLECLNGQCAGVCDGWFPSILISAGSEELG